MRVESKTPRGKSSLSMAASSFGTARSLDELELPAYIRLGTGIGELDRVLGGGLVVGSVVLISGEPGIGKSTLLMQLSAALCKNKKVLYVSGEESYNQLKLRAKRLSVSGKDIYLLNETNMAGILTEIDRLMPDVIIMDSIQTVFDERSASAPGSVTQIRECAMQFIERAKTKGISVILVGHVNKEGSIAGPKLLEHMVDAVLYFEGDQQQIYRIIRGIKNRYGSTNEIGVFEMTDAGLCEVENPSEKLLEGRPKNVSGNCAVCVMEGTRPVIAEIQALVTQTSFPSPRRTSNGIDYNRLYLLIAVLEKRLGLKFAVNDAYLNVIGGLRLNEPGADLGIALALISGIKDKPVPDHVVAIGEIGLSGELRAVSNVEQRIREAARLGFTKVLVPEKNVKKDFKLPNDIQVVKVKSIFDSLCVFHAEEK